MAEIIFQSLQADLVDYNLFRNYYAAKVLIPSDTTHYANAIKNGLKLPVNADLMYENYGIVGKSPVLTFDNFGRPSEAWVRDITTGANADLDTGDTASKYIPNNLAAADAVGTATEGANEIRVSLTMNPVAKYDNAVTECQVAKDINSDKEVPWDEIAEVLNGNAEADFTGAPTKGPKMGTTNTLNITAHTGNLDALHTSDKWIGANGRITEIYDVSGYNVTDGTNDQQFVIVYVDTFLAEVKSVTEAVLDPNDHEIKAATAKVKMGADEIEVALKGASKVGELVLVQTANYGAGTAIDDVTAVTVGEKVPVTPGDVHIVDADAFPAAGTDCVLYDKADTKRVTIKATLGVQDEKVGIITESGEYIYASNTFLANKTAGKKTVLPEWYDVDIDAKGITSSMIGRTFDLVLDGNGYIVGMKEVLTIESNVGIITGYDQHRVSSSKYLSAVEAYMADGSTQTFNVVNMTAAEVAKIGKDRDANAFDTSKFTFFKSGAAADVAWDVTAGVYANDAKLGIGSLVMFKQCTVDGVSAWYFEDGSDITTASATLLDKQGVAVTDNKMVGTALAAGASFNTGNALAIGTALELDATAPTPTMIDHQLDNKSVIFVAEPEYAYNTGTGNEGDNSMKYNVYQGFKKAPTVTQAAAPSANILYQQLVNHPEYVLVYPQRTNKEYIIRSQSTIMVDESYLVLSRGATYAQYSEYNVLKNGEQTTLAVSNSNDNLNAAIEAAMAAGDLLVVTGRNSAGYVIAVDTLVNLAKVDTVIAKNCGGVNDGTDDNPLVTGAVTTKFSENDGVLNFIDGATTDQGLTLADNCTVQLVNLGTGAVKNISLTVAGVYINKEGDANNYCDFTFELDQYGYVCNLYVIEK